MKQKNKRGLVLGGIAVLVILGTVTLSCLVSYLFYPEATRRFFPSLELIWPTIRLIFPMFVVVSMAWGIWYGFSTHEERLLELLKRTFPVLRDKEKTESQRPKEPTRRGPNTGTLERCKKAMIYWLDDGKSLQTSSQLAEVSPKTVKKWIPKVLQQCDEETRQRWRKKIKALGRNKWLGNFR